MTEMHFSEMRPPAPEHSDLAARYEELERAWETAPDPAARRAAIEEWERVRCRFATWYELAQVRFTQDTGDADYRFSQGHVDYNLAWILITFLGVFGVHRMYIGKWLTGILYLCTLGLLGLGVLYDYWTLNDQITVINRRGA